MSEAWELRRAVDKRDGSSSGWIVFTPEGPITYEIGTPLTENTACLIAAAPDMLAELEGILFDNLPMHPDRIYTIEQAIAKAKGVSSDR